MPDQLTRGLAELEARLTWRFTGALLAAACGFRVFLPVFAMGRGDGRGAALYPGLGLGPWPWSSGALLSPARSVLDALAVPGVPRPR